MKSVLTIAGFDPSSGAGVTADLMVFAAHGLFGTSCITALTVQSTRGVRETHPVAVPIVSATLRCLHEDLEPSGIKIGMLMTADVVSAVADYLESVRQAGLSIPVVIDPVLRSSSGKDLLSPDALPILRNRLLPLVDWVTPNLAELEVLTGSTQLTAGDIPEAAQKLQAMGCNLNVIVTCGGMIPPNDLLLVSGAQGEWLRGEHIETKATHGTGCTFSSALLSGIVQGRLPRETAILAKQYVAEAMRSASPLGTGNSPLNHLWTRPTFNQKA